MGLIKKAFRYILSVLDQRQVYKGLNLPPFRTNHGLSDNEAYLNSAIEQLEYLDKFKALDDSITFLDFGCGQGRIFNGMALSGLSIGKYIGVDTSKKSIDWCEKWLGNYDNEGLFIHLPAHNARYNPSASGLSTLPFETKIADVIFLNSVFSHMLADDVKFYLSEFRRVLKEDGVILLTAFIEEGVEDVTENPEGYAKKSQGRLHHVRYSKEYFTQLVHESDLSIKHFDYRPFKRYNQSVLVLVGKD